MLICWAPRMSFARLEMITVAKVPMTAADLVVGTICGGSDTTSGLAANPAMGVAFDLLVAAGGRAIFEETGELIGLEQVMAERAVTPALAGEILACMRKTEDYYRTLGQSSFAVGNAEGGLTTIEEKSLGCIYKAGTRPLQDVIEYAAPVTKKGLVWMDTPGHDIEQITGMVAGGCQLVVFTTGRGTPCGSPIAPTIKVATNTAMFEKMNDNMDLNAGTIISGDESVDEVGIRIFQEMLEVASGKLSKAEALGFNDFAIKRIGPTM